MSKEELLKYLIAEIDLIMHDKDYRFENEDGTWYSRESCRDLTNEEVFEELRTELRQLADLEAKLAITEKALELACKELRDDSCMRCNSCNRLEMCDYVLSLYPTSYFIEEAKEMLKNE